MTQDQNVKSLTDANYWDSTRPDTEKVVIKPNPLLSEYLSKLLPKRKDWTCLEIGVLPGGLLLWFAKQFGYKIHGLDFSDRVHHLKSEYDRHDVEAVVEQADFLKWKSEKKFKVVFSSGFIEHFEEYDEVIQKHWDVVASGGFLVIGIPSWSPVQRWLRKICFTKSHYAKIVESHNISMMNMKAFGDSMKSLDGSNIVFSSFIMNMRVWFKPGDPGVKKTSKPLFYIIRPIEKLLRILNVSHHFFSPYILIVAQKKDQEKSCIDKVVS